MKRPAVYIVENKRNGTFYTGVTSHLERRIYEHREGVLMGFSKRYGCKLLVWYEMHETMENAIAREKQLKAGRGDHPVVMTLRLEENRHQRLVA